MSSRDIVCGSLKALGDDYKRYCRYNNFMRRERRRMYPQSRPEGNSDVFTIEQGYYPRGKLNVLKEEAVVQQERPHGPVRRDRAPHRS